MLGLCLVVAFLLYGSNGGYAQEFYVTAFPNGARCPGDDPTVICHNLSFYLTQDYFIDNTNFIFLEGLHQLPIEPIVIEQVSNVTFQGVGDIVPGFEEGVSQSTSVLQCNEGNGGILMLFTSNIRIIQLTLNNCTTASFFENSHFNASLAIYNSLFVNIESLSVQNSSYNGLVLGNVLNISISKSVFARNANLGVNSTTAVLGFYEDFEGFARNGFFSIEESNISSSNFNGFVLMFFQQLYSVKCEIKSSKFVRSMEVNIDVSSYNSCRYELEIEEVLSTHSKIGFDFIARRCISKAIPLITVSKSVFAYNSDVGFSLIWVSPGVLTISSSNFSENIGVTNSALHIQQIKQQNGGNVLQVRLTNLIFQRNQLNQVLASSLGISNRIQYTMSVVYVNNVDISNCTFMDNSGSAIAVYQSAVTFSGVNTFMNNTGIYGGGLFISHGGSILLDLKSRLYFIDNHADKNGGAIYVSQTLAGIYDREGSSGISAYCFYQLREQITRISSNNESKIFVFQNNTAGVAGSAIYGGVIDSCVSISALANVQPGFFHNISSFIDQPGDTVISSRPRQVCFCDNNFKNCSVENKRYESFPGGNIMFSVVPVGSELGSTPGIVQITSNSSFQSLENIRVNESCTKIPYNVLVENSSIEYIKVHISVAMIGLSLFQAPLTIDVSIVPCAEGFYLSAVSGMCECIEEIADSNNAKCFPSTQLVERNGNLWIGYSDQLDCVIVNSHCPFDYCKSDRVNVSVANPDVQCTNSRSGQLCGECPKDLSLVLGSNACKDCSNNAAVLIVIPMVLAGIVLVAFILFLNLTVSIGTINGLIFFANIVKIYEPLFSIQSIRFLSQFISWINLDLGIETCFYDGMNSLVKIGLQFLFPFYLWIIIAVIIVVSRYSFRVAKFTGNTIIPVLATVVLLSYTKLVRTVITIFSTFQIHCNGDEYLYWCVDPTQRYLHGWHILLFVVGIAVLVLLIAPFTLFLLFYPLLEMLDEKWRQKLSWVVFKLKPFFDAYRGPYRGIFCCWPGVLILVRIGLALTVSLVVDASTAFVVLFVVSVLLVSVYSIKKVYNTGIHHIMDVGLLVALIFFSYLLKDAYGDDFRVGSVSWIGTIIILLFAFIVFICVIIYHAYKYSWLKKMCSSCTNRKSTNYDLSNSIPVVNEKKQKRLSNSSASELRESLLDEPY